MPYDWSDHQTEPRPAGYFEDTPDQKDRIEGSRPTEQDSPLIKKAAPINDQSGSLIRLFDLYTLKLRTLATSYLLSFHQNHTPCGGKITRS
jgi:hypothetical protein